MAQAWSCLPGDSWSVAIAGQLGMARCCCKPLHVTGMAGSSSHGMLCSCTDGCLWDQHLPKVVLLHSSRVPCAPQDVSHGMLQGCSAALMAANGEFQTAGSPEGCAGTQQRSEPELRSCPPKFSWVLGLQAIPNPMLTKLGGRAGSQPVCTGHSSCHNEVMPCCRAC